MPWCPVRMSTLQESSDVTAQFGVDAIDLFGSGIGVGVQDVGDAGQRDTGLGEGDDARQVDDRLRVVAPVS